MVHQYAFTKSAPLVELSGEGLLKIYKYNGGGGCNAGQRAAVLGARDVRILVFFATSGSKWSEWMNVGI